MAKAKPKKEKFEIDYKHVYERVLVGLEDNKKFVEKYKHNKNYLKGLQLVDEKKEHQTVVEYILPVIYTHLPNILPAGLNLEVQYSTDQEQRPAYLSKMYIKDLYQKRNYYYQFFLTLLDVLSSGLGWGHQTYRTLYTPEGKKWKTIPIVERCSPVDIIYDRTGYHFEEGVSGCINWLARRFRRNTLEIKADVRYKDCKYLDDLKGDSLISEKERKDKDLDKIKGSEGLKQSELYEVWLIPERRVVTFAKELGAEKPLRDMKNPYMSKDKYVIPFTMVKGYEIPDEFVARSEGDIIEGTQDELNIFRSYLINFFFRMLPTWLFETGAISEDQKRQLESGDMGMFIEILKAGGIEGLPIPPIPLGAMIQHIETIKREDIPTQSGISEYQMSKLPRGERTATEVMETQAGGRPRTTIKKNFFAIFMSRSLNNLLQILQMKMKGNYPITYPISEGGMRKIKTEFIEKKHIQGNLNVVVDISDQRSIDEQMKRKEKMGGLEKAMAVNPNTMDQIEVQKEILRLSGYDNVELWFPLKEEVTEEEDVVTGKPVGIPTETPMEVSPETEEVSPVTEGLKDAGAFTKHRPSFMGGIVDKIRSKLGGG